MYLAGTRPSEEYQGWNWSWDDIIKMNDSGIQSMTHLYFLLGLPENLSVDYQNDLQISVFQNVSRTLMNFGIPRPGVIDDISPLFSILDELDNDYPCIGICNSYTTNKINPTGGVFSFVADDYEIREFKGLDVYADGTNCPRTYTEYFINLKLPNLDLVQSICYYNWALFDPNYSKTFESCRNLRSPLPFPKAGRTYKEMYVLSEIGCIPFDDTSKRRKKTK